MAGAASAITSLLGPILGSVIGGLGPNSAAKWGQNSLVNVLNTLNQANGYGQGIFNQFSNPVWNQGLNNIATGESTLLAPNGGINDEQYNLANVLGHLDPNSFSGGTAANQAQGLANNPNSTNLQNYLTQLGLNGGIQNQGQANGMDQAGSLFAGQGSQQGLLGDIAGQLGVNGGLNLPLSQIQNTGTNVVNSLGQTGPTNAGLTSAQGLLQGVNPWVNALANAGLSGLSGTTPGLTNTGATGENVALSGLQHGGQTGFTNALQGLGLGYASQPAVLPAGLAASFASDQAGEQAKNAAQNVQAQALARGGGPGATVANGAANGGLADFADQIAQAQSNARQNSLLQQQGLNLQQQGQGAQMGLGAANTAAQQLGTNASLLNALEGTANQRYGISANNVEGANSQALNAIGMGLSGIGNLTNAQTNTAGTFGGLANNAVNAQTNRAGTAASTQNDLLNSMLNAGGLQNSQYGTALSGLFGANNGYTSNLGTSLNALQSLAGLSQNGANSFNNAYNNYIGSQTGINQLGLGLTNSGMNPLSGIAQSGLSYSGNAVNSEPGLFGGYAAQGLKGSQDASANLGGAVGAGGGGILQNLGNIFGKLFP